MHSGTFWNGPEHSGIVWHILEHSGMVQNLLELSDTFCNILEWSRTFWNCLTHFRKFWNSPEHSGTVHIVIGTRTDRQTEDIRTCWAASSQLKMKYCRRSFVTIKLLLQYLWPHLLLWYDLNWLFIHNYTLFTWIGWNNILSYRIWRIGT